MQWGNHGITVEILTLMLGRGRKAPPSRVTTPVGGSGPVGKPRNLDDEARSTPPRMREDGYACAGEGRGTIMLVGRDKNVFDVYSLDGRIRWRSSRIPSAGLVSSSRIRVQSCGRESKVIMQAGSADKQMTHGHSL